MGLKNLTKNIYFLPHEPEVDRPMLAYVKGDKFSLAVDAGYSKKHVQDFYRALRSCDLKEPDLRSLRIGIMTIHLAYMI